jgi:serralysin
LQKVVDYLTDGFWEYFDGGRRSFDLTEDRVVSYDTSRLSDDERFLATSAMEAWADVTGIRFVPVAAGASADLSYFNNNPGAYGGSTYSGDTIWTSTVNINTNWLGEPKSLNSYWFQAYLHEVGHALGLGHAGPYNGSANFAADAISSVDSWQASVMSYFSQVDNPNTGADYAEVVTAMPADILAMQALYGTDFRTRHGDTTYGHNSNVAGYLGQLFGAAFDGDDVAPLIYRDDRFAFTIFDTGGIDTINLASVTAAQKISLIGGTASDVNGLRGNMLIAHGVLIENAIGGQGDDQVIGNRMANRINGVEGNDSIEGGRGADRLIGGLGDDVLTGNRGRDVFVFSAGQDMIRDFADDRDTLVLSSALWGGRDLSVREVLRFAEVDGGDVMFRFRGVPELVLDGIRDKMQLVDDIVIL